MSGPQAFDMQAFKRSFEALEVDTIMGFYSDELEHIEVDSDGPPKSPRKSGAADIRGAFQGIKDGGLQLSLENAVVGEDRAACTITVVFPDDRKLISNTIFDIVGGKIARQLDVQVTDPEG